VPNFRNVHDGIRLAMPTINERTEKPRPALDHDQDISSIIKGSATPRDVNVAAVIWKKIRLTSVNLAQLLHASRDTGAGEELTCGVTSVPFGRP